MAPRADALEAIGRQISMQEAAGSTPRINQKRRAPPTDVDSALLFWSE